MRMWCDMSIINLIVLSITLFELLLLRLSNYHELTFNAYDVFIKIYITIFKTKYFSNS